jgi:hypothetical protein
MFRFETTGWARRLTGIAALAMVALWGGGCVEPPMGACCGVDEACTVATEAACMADGGVYQGDGTDCSTNAVCQEEITVFRYNGGPCPSELTVKDGDPGNVECGVPRSRLFDDASPLNGSLADADTTGFGIFPGVDNPDDTGIFVRLDNFAVNSNGPRANIVVICLNIVIPPQAGVRRAVKCKITRGAGFELTPEAQAVVNGGRRNYWAQQARKLAKLEADAAGGVDPGAARRADRLRRRFLRKNNTDYDVLADGTRYMEEMEEETEKIEIIPPRPGAILTFYLVFVGDAFASLGEFIPNLEIILTKDPGMGNPMLGDIEENALVIESVDEVGPVALVDYADGVFTPNLVDLTQFDNQNAQNAIWITNSSMSDLNLTVPGHPDTRLPAEQEIAFNDLLNGQIVGVNGATATLDIFSGQQSLACCIDGRCDDAFASEAECTNAGGTPVPNASCADNPCDPSSNPFEAALGNYLLEGTCPNNGQTVTLAHADDQLLLQGVPENNDVLLTLSGNTATGENVTAFGVNGHNLTLAIQNDGTINYSLFQPQTMGACQSVMAPVP